MPPLPHPVLFLDFDRTLLDTEKFYTWLGDDISEGILQLLSGERVAPDFRKYLYGDTLPFLAQMRESYRLVLLSYAVNIKMQELKIRSTGMYEACDDILVTTEEKGICAKSYLNRFEPSSFTHVFVDDVASHLVNVKKVNPEILCVLINRTGENVRMHEWEGDEVANLDELSDILRHQ